MRTTIIATATTESELKYSKTGTPFLIVPCAVNYNKQTENGWEKIHTDFLRVTVFTNAEELAEKLTKGTKFIADCELRTQKSQNQDGSVFLNVTANNIGLIEKKNKKQYGVSHTDTHNWDAPF